MEAAVGVIALALQVVDTSVKIKRVINDYRTVSQDINRLATKIDRAEAICRAIETRLQVGSMESGPASLLRQLGPPILNGINTTLMGLDEILSRLEARATRKGGAKLVGFSFLTKKDTVQKLGRELDEDLTSLQHLMTAEVISRVEAIHQKFEVLSLSQSTRTHELGETNEAHESLGSHTSTAQTMTQRPGSSTRVDWNSSHTVQSWPFQVHTSMKYRRITKRAASGIIITNERKAFSVGHQLLSFRIELVWGYGTFTSPWCSLRLPHYLSLADELSTPLLEAIGSNDVIDFQYLLMSREIYLETTIDDVNLFYVRIDSMIIRVLLTRPRVAWVYHASDICHFLLQQVSIDYVEAIPPISLGLIRISPDADELEDSSRIPDMLALRQSSFEISDMGTSPLVADFKIAVELGDTPEQLEICFDYYRTHAEHGLGGLTEFAWERAVEQFAHPRQGFRGTLSGWKKLFRKILGSGNIDINKPIPIKSERHKMSPVMAIFHRNYLRGDLWTYLTEWLEILQACNVNVQQYLDREYHHCIGVFNPGHFWKSWDVVVGLEVELCQVKLAGFDVPYLKLRADKDNPFSEFLQIYQHLGRYNQREYVAVTIVKACEDLPWLSEEDRVLAWKQLSLIDKTWPFSWKLCTWETREGHWHLDALGLWSSFQKACALSEQRFERRCRKRLIKSGALKSTKGATMPGSWIKD